MTHLKPRSAEKVLYQGDDMARMAELQRAVVVAKRQAAQQTSRLGDDFEAQVTEAQEALNAFIGEAADRAVTVVIQSIGRRRFRDLVAAHPPRVLESEPDEDGETVKSEHPDDEGYGVNTETFAPALLCYRDGDFVTIADPKFDSAADLERFVDDELADGDFEELWVAAYMLNRGPSADPKLLVVSTSDSRSSDET